MHFSHLWYLVRFQLALIVATNRICHGGFDNTRMLLGVLGISERHVDLLALGGVVRCRCDAYWTCFVSQSWCTCCGRWLEFWLEKVNKVSVVGLKEKIRFSGNIRGRWCPFPSHVNDTQNISQNFVFVTQGLRAIRNWKPSPTLHLCVLMTMLH